MNDFQMARGHDDGWHNLAVGEPFFIQDALDFIKFADGKGSFTYPLTNGQPELLNELKELHPDKHIVVANGAKHAITAAFYAYFSDGYYTAWHKAPYWPSYPTLAKLGGLMFSSDHTQFDPSSAISVSTSPNNPDSRQGETPCDIWDAVYAHPVYGFIKAPKHDVAIHSASKVFGMSACRVGWLVTENEEIAKRASQYVEITTSGVCSFAQRQVAEVLRYVRMNPNETNEKFQIAREQLIMNATSFNVTLKKHCEIVQGVPESHSGGFAWFKVKDNAKFSDALKTTKIKLVTGEACGMTEPGWYRMNMMFTNSKLNPVLDMLDRELQK